MKPLSFIPWLSDVQRAVLGEHRVVTLEELASLELRDSFADAPPLDDLRDLARRARVELGRDDPLEQIGAAAGQRPGTRVKYAGAVRYGSADNG